MSFTEYRNYHYYKNRFEKQGFSLNKRKRWELPTELEKHEGYSNLLPSTTAKIQDDLDHESNPRNIEKEYFDGLQKMKEMNKVSFRKERVKKRPDYLVNWEASQLKEMRDRVSSVWYWDYHHGPRGNVKFRNPVVQLRRAEISKKEKRLRKSKKIGLKRVRIEHNRQKKQLRKQIKNLEKQIHESRRSRKRQKPQSIFHKSSKKSNKKELSFRRKQLKKRYEENSKEIENEERKNVEKCILENEDYYEFRNVEDIPSLKKFCSRSRKNDSEKYQDRDFGIKRRELRSPIPHNKNSPCVMIMTTRKENGGFGPLCIGSGDVEKLVVDLFGCNLPKLEELLVQNPRSSEIERLYEMSTRLASSLEGKQQGCAAFVKVFIEMSRVDDASSLELVEVELRRLTDLWNTLGKVEDIFWTELHRAVEGNCVTLGNYKADLLQAAGGKLFRLRRCSDASFFKYPRVRYVNFFFLKRFAHLLLKTMKKEVKKCTLPIKTEDMRIFLGICNVCFYVVRNLDFKSPPCYGMVVEMIRIHDQIGMHNLFTLVLLRHLKYNFIPNVSDGFTPEELNERIALTSQLTIACCNEYRVANLGRKLNNADQDIEEAKRLVYFVKKIPSFYINHATVSYHKSFVKLPWNYEFDEKTRDFRFIRNQTKKHLFTVPAAINFQIRNIGNGWCITTDPCRSSSYLLFYNGMQFCLQNDLRPGIYNLDLVEKITLFGKHYFYIEHTFCDPAGFLIYSGTYERRVDICEYHIGEVECFDSIFLTRDPDGTVILFDKGKKISEPTVPALRGVFMRLKFSDYESSLKYSDAWLQNPEIIKSILLSFVEMGMMDSCSDFAIVGGNVAEKRLSYDYSSFTRSNTRERISQYEYFNMFSKTYQELLVTLMLLRDQEESIFSQIPHDVLLYEIIPHIPEIGYFLRHPKHEDGFLHAKNMLYHVRIPVKKNIAVEDLRYLYLKKQHRVEKDYIQNPYSLFHQIRMFSGVFDGNTNPVRLLACLRYVFRPSVFEFFCDLFRKEENFKTGWIDDELEHYDPKDHCKELVEVVEAITNPIYLSESGGESGGEKVIMGTARIYLFRLLGKMVGAGCEMDHVFREMWSHIPIFCLVFSHDINPTCRHPIHLLFVALIRWGSDQKFLQLDRLLRLFKLADIIFAERIPDYRFESIFNQKSFEVADHRMKSKLRGPIQFLPNFFNAIRNFLTYNPKITEENRVLLFQRFVNLSCEIMFFLDRSWNNNYNPSNGIKAIYEFFNEFIFSPSGKKNLSCVFSDKVLLKKMFACGFLLPSFFGEKNYTIEYAIMNVGVGVLRFCYNLINNLDVFEAEGKLFRSSHYWIVYKVYMDFMINHGKKKLPHLIRSYPYLFKNFLIVLKSRPHPHDALFVNEPKRGEFALDSFLVDVKREKNGLEVTEAIEEMMKAGYSKVLIVKAMISKKMDIEEAIKWVEQHKEDEMEKINEIRIFHKSGKPDLVRLTETIAKSMNLMLYDFMTLYLNSKNQDDEMTMNDNFDSDLVPSGILMSLEARLPLSEIHIRGVYHVAEFLLEFFELMVKEKRSGFMEDEFLFPKGKTPVLEFLVFAYYASTYMPLDMYIENRVMALNMSCRVFSNITEHSNAIFGHGLDLEHVRYIERISFLNKQKSVEMSKWVANAIDDHVFLSSQKELEKAMFDVVVEKYTQVFRNCIDSSKSEEEEVEELEEQKEEKDIRKGEEKRTGSLFGSLAFFHFLMFLFEERSENEKDWEMMDELPVFRKHGLGLPIPLSMERIKKKGSNIPQAWYNEAIEEISKEILKLEWKTLKGFESKIFLGFFSMHQKKFSWNGSDILKLQKRWLKNSNPPKPEPYFTALALELSIRPEFNTILSEKVLKHFLQLQWDRIGDRSVFLFNMFSNFRKDQREGIVEEFVKYFCGCSCCGKAVFKANGDFNPLVSFESSDFSYPMVKLWKNLSDSIPEFPLPLLPVNFVIGYAKLSMNFPQFLVEGVVRLWIEIVDDTMDNICGILDVALENPVLEKEIVKYDNITTILDGFVAFLAMKRFHTHFHDTRRKYRASRNISMATKFLELIKRNIDDVLKGQGNMGRYSLMTVFDRMIVSIEKLPQSEETIEQSYFNQYVEFVKLLISFCELKDFQRPAICDSKAEKGSSKGDGDSLDFSSEGSNFLVELEFKIDGNQEMNFNFDDEADTKKNVEKTNVDFSVSGGMEGAIDVDFFDYFLPSVVFFKLFNVEQEEDGEIENTNNEEISDDPFASLMFQEVEGAHGGGKTGQNNKKMKKKLREVITQELLKVGRSLGRLETLEELEERIQQTEKASKVVGFGSGHTVSQQSSSDEWSSLPVSDTFWSEQPSDKKDSIMDQLKESNVGHLMKNEDLFTEIPKFEDEDNVEIEEEIEETVQLPVNFDFDENKDKDEEKEEKEKQKDFVFDLSDDFKF